METMRSTWTDEREPSTEFLACPRLASGERVQPRIIKEHEQVVDVRKRHPFEPQPRALYRCEGSEVGRR